MCVHTCVGVYVCVCAHAAAHMASAQNWQGYHGNCFSCEHVQSQLVEGSLQRSLQRRNRTTDARMHAYTHTHNPLPNNLVATPAFTTAMGPPPAVSTGCTGSSTVGTLPGDIAGCVVTMVTGIAPAGRRVGGAGSKPPNQEKGWTQVIIHVHT